MMASSSSSDPPNQGTGGRGGEKSEPMVANNQRLLYNSFEEMNKRRARKPPSTASKHTRFMDPAKVLSLINKKSRKLENYKLAEDLILIAAWEHTSEDVVRDTDQRKDQYWYRVWKKYCENSKSYPVRSMKSISNRFSAIKTNCLKFDGIVRIIENTNPNGMTENEKLNEALKIWATVEKVKSGFKFLHCYNILKDLPKWIIKVVNPSLNQSIPTSSPLNSEDDLNDLGNGELEMHNIREPGEGHEKKTLNMEDGNQSPTSSPLNSGDDLNDSGNGELEIHNVREEPEEGHEKKTLNMEDADQSPTSTNLCESQEFMPKVCGMMNVPVEDSKSIDLYLQIEREKLELARKRYESLTDWRNIKLMTVDMTHLNEMQRKYVEMKQAKVYEKAFNP